MVVKPVSANEGTEEAVSPVTMATDCVQWCREAWTKSVNTYQRGKNVWGGTKQQVYDAFVWLWLMFLALVASETDGSATVKEKVTGENNDNKRNEEPATVDDVQAIVERIKVEIIDDNHLQRSSDKLEVNNFVESEKSSQPTAAVAAFTILEEDEEQEEEEEDQEEKEKLWRASNGGLTRFAALENLASMRSESLADEEGPSANNAAVEDTAAVEEESNKSAEEDIWKTLVAKYASEEAINVEVPASSNLQKAMSQEGDMAEGFNMSEKEFSEAVGRRLEEILSTDSVEKEKDQHAVEDLKAKIIENTEPEVEMKIEILEECSRTTEPIVTVEEIQKPKVRPQLRDLRIETLDECHEHVPSAFKIPIISHQDSDEIKENQEPRKPARPDLRSLRIETLDDSDSDILINNNDYSLGPRVELPKDETETPVRSPPSSASEAESTSTSDAHPRVVVTQPVQETIAEENDDDKDLEVERKDVATENVSDSMDTDDESEEVAVIADFSFKLRPKEKDTLSFGIKEETASEASILDLKERRSPTASPLPKDEETVFIKEVRLPEEVEKETDNGNVLESTILPEESPAVHDDIYDEYGIEGAISQENDTISPAFTETKIPMMDDDIPPPIEERYNEDVREAADVTIFKKDDMADDEAIERESEKLIAEQVEKPCDSEYSINIGEVIDDTAHPSEVNNVSQPALDDSVLNKDDAAAWQIAEANDVNFVKEDDFSRTVEESDFVPVEDDVLLTVDDNVAVPIKQDALLTVEDSDAVPVTDNDNDVLQTVEESDTVPVIDDIDLQTVEENDTVRDDVLQTVDDSDAVPVKDYDVLQTVEEIDAVPVKDNDISETVDESDLPVENDNKITSVDTDTSVSGKDLGLESVVESSVPVKAGDSLASFDESACVAGKDDEEVNFWDVIGDAEADIPTASIPAEQDIPAGDAISTKELEKLLSREEIDSTGIEVQGISASEEHVLLETNEDEVPSGSSVKELLDAEKFIPLETAEDEVRSESPVKEILHEEESRPLKTKEVEEVSKSPERLTEPDENPEVDEFFIEEKSSLHKIPYKSEDNVNLIKAPNSTDDNNVTKLRVDKITDDAFLERSPVAGHKFPEDVAADFKSEPVKSTITVKNVNSIGRPATVIGKSNFFDEKIDDSSFEEVEDVGHAKAVGDLDIDDQPQESIFNTTGNLFSDAVVDETFNIILDKEASMDADESSASIKKGILDTTVYDLDSTCDSRDIFDSTEVNDGNREVASSDMHAADSIGAIIAQHMRTTEDHDHLADIRDLLSSKDSQAAVHHGDPDLSADLSDSGDLDQDGELYLMSAGLTEEEEAELAELAEIDKKKSDQEFKEFMRLPSGLTQQELDELAELQEEKENVQAVREAERKELEKFLSMPVGLTEKEQQELTELLNEETEDADISAATEERLAAFLAAARAESGYADNLDEEEEEAIDKYLHLPDGLTEEEELMLREGTDGEVDLYRDEEYRESIRRRFLADLEDDEDQVLLDEYEFAEQYGSDFEFDEDYAYEDDLEGDGYMGDESGRIDTKITKASAALPSSDKPVAPPRKTKTSPVLEPSTSTGSSAKAKSRASTSTASDDKLSKTDAESKNSKDSQKKFFRLGALGIKKKRKDDSADKSDFRIVNYKTVRKKLGSVFSRKDSGYSSVDTDPGISVTPLPRKRKSTSTQKSAHNYENETFPVNICALKITDV